IKWRGSATKATLRNRRSRGARNTIYFYIGIFYDTEKNAYLYCSCFFWLISIFSNLNENCCK
ncbi:hypothetical protein TSAR_009077, partial [Trichomalopsis sarcophagae]